MDTFKSSTNEGSDVSDVDAAGASFNLVMNERWTERKRHEVCQTTLFQIKLRFFFPDNQEK
jgi:hypothetical protein